MSANFTKTIITDKIMTLFEQTRPHVNYGSPYRTSQSNIGRRPTLDSIEIGGLALWYLKSKCFIYELCPILGIVPSSACVWLDYAMEVLYRTVKDPLDTDFEIRWPSERKIEDSAALLEQNRQHGDLLCGTLVVTDSARMPCATCDDPDMQNAYWDGYTQADEVTNLFF